MTQVIQIVTANSGGPFSSELYITISSATTNGVIEIEILYSISSHWALQKGGKVELKV